MGLFVIMYECNTRHVCAAIGTEATGGPYSDVLLYCPPPCSLEAEFLTEPRPRLRGACPSNPPVSAPPTAVKLQVT